MIYLYKEEKGFLALSKNDALDIWVLHVEIDPTRWSVKEYKRYKGIFEIIKQELKKVTNQVYSFCKTNSHIKFNKKFGFELTGAFNVTDTGEIETILYLDLGE